MPVWYGTELELQTTWAAAMLKPLARRAATAAAVPACSGVSSHFSAPRLVRPRARLKRVCLAHIPSSATIALPSQAVHKRAHSQGICCQMTSEFELNSSIPGTPCKQSYSASLPGKCCLTFLRSRRWVQGKKPKGLRNACRAYWVLMLCSAPMPRPGA